MWCCCTSLPYDTIYTVSVQIPLGNPRRNITILCHNLKCYKRACVHCHFSYHFSYHLRRLIIFYHCIILYVHILQVLFCCNFSNMVVKLEWTNWSRTLYLCSLQGSIPVRGLIANTWFSSKSATNWIKDFKSWSSCRLFWLNLKNNCFFICF